MAVLRAWKTPSSAFETSLSAPDASVLKNDDMVVRMQTGLPAGYPKFMCSDGRR